MTRCSLALAALVSFSALGCKSSAAENAPRAHTDAAGASVNGGKRIRNDATNLCLQVRPSLDVITAATCGEASLYERFRLTEASSGLFTVRPENAPSQCLTLLVPEPGEVPVLGPCSGADPASAGQLFRLNPSSATHYTMSDPGRVVYLTALEKDTGGVVMDVPGHPAMDHQLWALLP